MITDFTMDGVLVAGEVRDMPSVVIFAGTTGATENIHEKMEISVTETIAGRVGKAPVPVQCRYQKTVPLPV